MQCRYNVCVTYLLWRENKSHCEDEQKNKEWLIEQKELLKTYGAYQVIINIKSVKSKTNKVKEVKEKVIHCFEENRERMYYGS